MATLTAEMGFDGIDLTVRPNGHVEPARVEEDLPKAVEAARKAGIQIPMITTAILSASDSLTDKVLKTAGLLGIKSYRMGWMSYDNAITIDENLRKFESEFKSLESLNKKYNVRGEYQNHSGAYLGSAVWDVMGIIKKCDPRWVGLQYDILHATVEGANAWIQGLRNASPHVTSMPIKDFHWTKKDGKWTTEVVPLGEGAVELTKYLGMLKSLNIKGPFSMHFEYPLGGVENGTKSLTIDKLVVVASMTRDLKLFREKLIQAKLVE
jgi:sugar phosphate isomerase/epimerase